MKIYAGAAGFVGLDEAEAHAETIASANWRATAELVALRTPDALLIDVGRPPPTSSRSRRERSPSVGADDAGRLRAGRTRLHGAYAQLRHGYGRARAVPRRNGLR